MLSCTFSTFSAQGRQFYFLLQFCRQGDTCELIQNVLKYFYDDFLKTVLFLTHHGPGQVQSDKLKNVKSSFVDMTLIRRNIT